MKIVGILLIPGVALLSGCAGTIVESASAVRDGRREVQGARGPF